MKTRYWMLIALLVAASGVAAGYKVASASGIEPQHFEAVESGGYGASASDLEAIGFDKSTTDYYQDLQK